MRARKKLLVLGAVALTALTVTGVAVAAWWMAYVDGIPATARYQDVDRAVEAGYSLRLPDLSGATCIAQPGQGAMGVHMVNTSLLDGTIDSKRPEALVYEPTRGDRLRLVAVEYVVFESDWKGSSPPSLFGRTFDYVGEGNRYGLPAFWALHSWIWKPNPSGLFNAWNPRVECGH
jgi:hypothetical protein